MAERESQHQCLWQRGEAVCVGNESDVIVRGCRIMDVKVKESGGDDRALWDGRLSGQPAFERRPRNRVLAIRPWRQLASHPTNGRGSDVDSSFSSKVWCSTMSKTLLRSRLTSTVRFGGNDLFKPSEVALRELEMGRGTGVKGSKAVLARRGREMSVKGWQEAGYHNFNRGTQ